MFVLFIVSRPMFLKTPRCCSKGVSDTLLSLALHNRIQPSLIQYIKVRSQLCTKECFCILGSRGLGPHLAKVKR